VLQGNRLQLRTHVKRRRLLGSCAARCRLSVWDTLTGRPDIPRLTGWPDQDTRDQAFQDMKCFMMGCEIFSTYRTGFLCQAGASANDKKPTRSNDLHSG
jgi:hypothetical protein